MHRFAASLGPDERRLHVGVGLAVGLGVGVGVGIGMPVAFGLAFGFDRWILQALAVNAVALYFALVWPRRFRPLGFLVDENTVYVERAAGRKEIVPLASIAAITHPAAPPALNHGAAGGFTSQGYYGSWGRFKSQQHGTFDAWLTDHRKTVEIVLSNGSYVFVSPDDPDGFVEAVASAAAGLGAPVDVGLAGDLREERAVTGAT